MYNAQNNLSGYNVNKQYLTIIYHGKKRKDFQSPMIVSNMIHVKRLYQTCILNIAENHCNITYLGILLC